VLTVSGRHFFIEKKIGSIGLFSANIYKLWNFSITINMSLEKRKDLLQSTKLISKNVTDFSVQKNDEEETYQQLKTFIQKNVQEVLVWECQEDIWITRKEAEKFPISIRHFLRYSERRGIKYYILRKEDLLYLIVWVFGSTWGRTNEYYFDQLLKDPDLESKISTTQFQLSEILGLRGKWLKFKRKVEKMMDR